MHRKLLFSAFLSVVVAASMSVGAIAASNLEEIKAYINHDLHLSLKGQEWQPKDEDGAELTSITYNGSTYLPVRAVGEAFGVKIGWNQDTQTVLIGEGEEGSEGYTATITFPSDKYPETAAHIRAAVANGEPAVCTIEREGADNNRDHSLAGIPTKKGYDRDEWPMAMCQEGGTGADIAYIEPKDNRGAGSWVSHELEGYPDGSRILFVVPDPGDEQAPEEATTSTSTNAQTSTETSSNVEYKNCTEARAAGVTPLHIGDPGYSSKLDRDGDGVACEN